MTMVQWSSTLLLAAFILYTIGTIVFAVGVMGKNFQQKSGGSAGHRIGRWGFAITLIGFASQVGYFVTRWLADGHIPDSNLFEYTTLFSMMMVLAFIIIFLIYKNNSVGMLTLPIAVIIIAYASVFPRTVEPLIPALQSNWLMVHVTTVCLGEGILSISFVAGLVYLLKVVDQQKSSKQTFWLEFVMFSMVCVIAFAIISTVFQQTDYKTSYSWINQKGNQATLVYQMPSIVGPYQGKHLDHHFGPLFEAPNWMNGVDAPKQFNTVIWSFMGGIILYCLIRLLLRRRISAALSRILQNVNPPLMDEISYRAVAIGFPIFTLGGIVFAAIWAEQAWSRFWGWDPKEVWALITFFFYAAYLHFRLTRGWVGEKSAWLSVIGFVIIMFNLIFVNLVIAGLHSYA